MLETPIRPRPMRTCKARSLCAVSTKRPMMTSGWCGSAMMTTADPRISFFAVQQQELGWLDSKLQRADEQSSGHSALLSWKL